MNKPCKALNTSLSIHSQPILSLLVLLLALSLASSLPAPAHAELREGDPAPNFAVSGSDGKLHSLSDSRGTSPVVIAFFPKAFTGG